MTALQGLPALPRRARAASAAAAVLLVALSLLAITPTSDAAFSSASTRGGTFVADTLDPPSGLSARRDCLSPMFRSTSVNGSTTTSATVNAPSGLTAGDVMIAWGVTGGTLAITAPAGWTELQEIQTGNATMRASVFWKRAGTSEPASYTFSWQVSGLVGISAYRGVDSTTAIDVSAISGTTAKVTSVSSPAVTTTVAQTRLLHNYWVQNVNDGTYSSATKLRAFVPVTAGMMVMLDEARPAAGATTARAVNYATAQYGVTSAVALRPASGNASSITLAWTATPDTYATGYELSRDGAAPSSIAGRTTTSTTDTAVTDTTSYSYSLRSVFSSWRSTAVSRTVGTC